MGPLGYIIGALIGLAVLIAIGVGIYFAIKSFSPFPAKKIGEECVNDTECEGWQLRSALCCSGKCTEAVRDWAEVGQCPEVCQDAPSPLGKPGTCDSGLSWPRKENEPCDTHAACEGWVAGKPGTLGCCNEKCTILVKDWAGVGYCPDECQDAPSPLGKPGTCDSGLSWPRKQGEPCDTHTACDGWVAGKPGTLACCNEKCEIQLKDWAGVGYCPAECQDAPSPLGKPGSCGSGFSWPRKEGEPCDVHTSCDGWVSGKPGTLACCNNICTKQLKDWAGVGYCPAECQDAPSPLGKPGSCGSGFSWPRKEGQPCDTHTACEGWVAGKPGTLACCNGVCTKQLKDWAGVGYCPAECVGCIGCEKGTC